MLVWQCAAPRDEPGSVDDSVTASDWTKWGLYRESKSRARRWRVLCRHVARDLIVTWLAITVGDERSDDLESVRRLG